MALATMKVKHPGGDGFMTINAEDFDASTMEVWPEASPEPVAEPVSEPMPELVPPVEVMGEAIKDHEEFGEPSRRRRGPG